MLSSWTKVDGRLQKLDLYAGAPIPRDSLWIDLHDPTALEIQQVEEAFALKLPPPEKRREIESSSRLFIEGNMLVMTSAVMTTVGSDHPRIEEMTFVAIGPLLITLRQTEFRAVDVACERIRRQPDLAQSGEGILLALLEAFVDRIADHIESCGQQLDEMSLDILDMKPGMRALKEKLERRVRRRNDGEDMRIMLRRIGLAADIASKAQEALLSMTRLCLFYQQEDPLISNPASKLPGVKDRRARLKTIQRDVKSLLDYTALLNEKVTFLLDASLGLIQIRQNEVVKVLTVVWMMFLPATLIASIYGMNFEVMPELKWNFGYLWALGLMLLSGITVFALFKRRGYM